MSAERFIAWKFMLKGTEQGTFSPMTVFAWLALGVGVWAMGSLLSVMYGFEGALKERVLKAYPHILIKPKEGGRPIENYQEWTQDLASVDGVLRVTPFLETEMIVQSDFRSIGAVVQGLSQEELLRKKDTLTRGKLPTLEGDRAGVLLGSELAKRIGAFLGAEIKIISPVKTTGAAGLIPQSQVFEVVGIFSSGHYQFDQQFLYALLPDAQDLVREGDVISGWQIWGDSYEAAEGLQKRIAEILPSNIEAQSWTVFNSALFQSLKLEQFAMFLIFSFAIAIAVMNIAMTLMMYVVHKKKNIGILRAMGASRKQIQRVFVWQGIWIGGTGLALGVVATIATLVFIQSTELQLPDIYYDRSIPIEIRPWSFVMIYGIATIMLFLATLYPAKKAMNVDPIEAIRS